MSKTLTNIDFSGNQALNMLFHVLASAPSSPAAGQSYYNSTSKVVFTWNGTAWRPHDAAALTDGSVPNSALATNPLARANHTGTQTASTVSDLSTVVQAYRLDQFAAPTVSVSFGTQRITNVVDPSSAQDAATKNYVDGALQSAAAGIDSKPSVRAVAVANVTTLSGTTTQDGVSLIANDRLLLTGQTTASANGVYVIAAGAWSRALDADQTGEITPGAFWFVEEGTTYGKTQWRCNNTGAITLGTTSVAIVQFGAANLYSATAPITLTGGAFGISLGTGITTSGGNLIVDNTVVVRKYATSIGDGSTLSYTVTHNLGTLDVLAQTYLNSTGETVLCDVVRATTNTLTVSFASAPASNAIRVLVQG